MYNNQIKPPVTISPGMKYGSTVHRKSPSPRGSWPVKYTHSFGTDDTKVTTSLMVITTKIKLFILTVNLCLNNHTHPVSGQGK